MVSICSLPSWVSGAKSLAHPLAPRDSTSAQSVSPWRTKSRFTQFSSHRVHGGYGLPTSTHLGRRETRPSSAERGDAGPCRASCGRLSPALPGGLSEVLLLLPVTLSGV